MKNTLKIRIKSIICALGMMAAVFLLNVPVFAANKTVTITEVTPASSEVEVEGTTDAEAVIVQLRDATGDNIIAMNSFAVVDGAFSGSITDVTIEDNTEYMIFVADYEGGDFATETFKIEVTTEATTTATTEATTVATTTESAPEKASEAEVETTAADTAKNDTTAQTGDTTPVALFIALMLVSCAGIVTVMKMRKRTR